MSIEYISGSLFCKAPLSGSLRPSSPPFCPRRLDTPYALAPLLELPGGVTGDLVRIDLSISINLRNQNRDKNHLTNTRKVDIYRYIYQFTNNNC